jgi:hypothetical protein
MVLRPERGPRWRWLSVPVLLAAAGVGAVVLLGMLLFRGSPFGLPDLFDGGESDPAPRGGIIYEGQTALSASEEFMVDIGNGEAIVAVKAKQDHDRPGNIFHGDFQSTNGTSSVADPDDGDLPASLAVKVDYCAEGLITTTDELDEDDNVVTSIRLEMGDLFVCDTTLEHTQANDAAFTQDDTPNDFHGRFVSFVAGAAETAAAAAPCPVRQLERFGADEITSYLERRLARRYRIPVANVEVVSGAPGESSDETKAELRERLESYTNLADPDDPDRTFEALSIQYLSSEARAVDDSCYKDAGSTDLETLENLDAPDPTR